MTALPSPRAVRELEAVDADSVVERVLDEGVPVVIRGLVGDWPLVQAAREAPDDGIDYLLARYNGAPVNAFLGEQDIGGRIFYTEGLERTNFQQVQAPMTSVLEQIRRHFGKPVPPTVYMGSMPLEYCLPGMRETHSLPFGDFRPTVRIWLGNRTIVAAHYDDMDNIACVCAGRRRFTVFPPEQVANLYVGPVDFTPAGQSISLVDPHAPDLDRFPRYLQALENAQTSELEPGDAIFIPSLWWHQVEGLDDFNILINHWWRQAPNYLGTPNDALLHAILSIRDLPSDQRRAWRVLFEHYVFGADGETAAHIPTERRGVLGQLDENAARRLRALLRNNLNR